MRDALIRCIAGNDGCVDRADRNPGDPVGQILRGRQRLVDTRLIAAERAATLQNEANLLVLCRARRVLDQSSRVS